MDFLLEKKTEEQDFFEMKENLSLSNKKIEQVIYLLDSD